MSSNDSKVAQPTQNLPVQQPAHRRGIYLLPNLLTTAALFAGFFSIVSAINGDFVRASIAIFAAQLLDGMDGRVARMTHTQSEFGAQYDSMSDNMAFGVAPAILIFQWSLHSLDNLGWVAAFIFVAGASLRLARFNIQINSVDKKFFVGLASPAGAAILWGSVWALTKSGVAGESVAWIMVVVVPLVGAMMVSPIRYYSFKDLSDRGRVPFVVLLLSVAVLALIALDPPRVLLGMAVLYALSGPVFEIWRRARQYRNARKSGTS
ncbi:CDP-diacylglycerol--serine O-phosphatidyltransferase [Saccharospirillum sp. HFRX-1]|uniref:CDP-diacylglycerol--serine O-phosphatidyltransferase n=1 Tax=unclassified Saccharospirillum TaxID=2633430 RepID=UPI003713DDC9